MNSSESWKSFDTVWKNYKIVERRPGNLVGSFFEELRIKELQEFFKGKRTIINVGSGSGKWSFPFLRMGYEVTNFDISQYALQISKKRCRDFRANNVRGDVHTIPFKDNTFDIVMSFGLLEHFENIYLPIKEMVRVLKPGGLFLSDIITKRFSVQTLQRWINFFLYIVYSLMRFDFVKLRKSTWFIHKNYYENTFSQREYLEAMEIAGLSNINIKGIRCFPIIMFPYFLEKIYLPVFRLFNGLFNHFDRKGTQFSNFWGAIWEARGKKEFVKEDDK
ncbi:methyltransferase domain-containing protein [candidate division WOR-3 bacterium]|nr:methyltransferase domain-containing protein [candidate division WOR-3 bacterium]